MDNIGGFFEFEIASGNSLYHDDAIALSTGRACLNYIIQQKPFEKYYLPYYCCDALFEPLIINNIPFEFYAIDSNFELQEDLKLQTNEALIYCNFFGIKKDYVNKLIINYGSQLILDNSHSFFEKGYKDSTSFTTARKYFGVPDGAFLYLPESIIDVKDLSRNTNVSVNHLINRLVGLQEKAFKEFQQYESSLNSDIQRLSLFSEKILKTLDYTAIRDKRNYNFKLYKDAFKSLNKIVIENSVKDAFCYPLLLPKPISKTLFYEQRIFIPSYWLDVTKRENSDFYDLECSLSNNILPLPIDHRYESDVIERVIHTVKKLVNG